MEELNEKVLNFVRQSGPVLPVHVAREVKMDPLFASAVLSDLRSQNLIEISKGKIGGSPVYYVQGQEPKLQMLLKYLSDKPKRAFEILKEKKLLREKECEPWLRVALRDIKDFAMPLVADINGDEEVFWKWYLLPDEEAENIVKGMIKPKEVPKEDVKPKEPEAKKEEAKDVQEEKPKEIKKPGPLKEEKRHEHRAKERKKAEGDFARKVSHFLDSKNIMVLEEKWLRKNSDYEAVVRIPSSAGRLAYYLKAKSKKSINEAELSLAYSEGQERRLPVFFLSGGELTKKAEQFAKERFKGLVFKNI